MNVQDFGPAYEYAKGGEELVQGYGELMLAGEAFCEVKRKKRTDFSFYVETEQTTQHGRGPVEPSGINARHALTAPLFAFVLHDTGIVVVFPTVLLRDAIGRPIATPKQQSAEHQGNPTRGMLIALERILNRYEPDGSGYPVPVGGWKETSEL